MSPCPRDRGKECVGDATVISVWEVEYSPQLINRHEQKKESNRDQCEVHCAFIGHVEEHVVRLLSFLTCEGWRVVCKGSRVVCEGWRVVLRVPPGPSDLLTLSSPTQYTAPRQLPPLFPSPLFTEVCVCACGGVPCCLEPKMRSIHSWRCSDTYLQNTDKSLCHYKA
jgi:hypothetical protein